MSYEVVRALCLDGAVERPPADGARKREAIVNLLLLITLNLTDGLLHLFLLLLRLPVSLDLPACLVVAAVVHEFASVTESTVAGLLPVLAKIGLVVKSDSRGQEA